MSKPTRKSPESGNSLDNQKREPSASGAIFNSKAIALLDVTTENSKSVSNSLPRGIEVKEEASTK